jgi:elongation factor Ts
MDAQQIKILKEVREKTGAGYSDANMALKKANWDLPFALSLLKKLGLTKQTKKGVKFDGLSVFSEITPERDYGFLFSIMSQTDFVIKHEKISEFGKELGKALLEKRVSGDDLDKKANSLHLEKYDETVQNALKQLSSYFSEPLKLSSIVVFNKGFIYNYLHRSNSELPYKLGVMLSTDSKREYEEITPILYTAASYKPKYLTLEDIVDSEWEARKTLLVNSGFLQDKPSEIREKAITAKVKSDLAKCTLYTANLVTDDKLTVNDYVNQQNFNVIDLVCL